MDMANYIERIGEAAKDAAREAGAEPTEAALLKLSIVKQLRDFARRDLKDNWHNKLQEK